MASNSEFQRIYLRYKTYAASIAYRIVHDRNIAEDISQEVFYNLYKMGEKLDTTDESRIKALIATAAVNKSRDHLKKSYVKMEICASDKREQEVKTTADPDEVLMKIEAQKSMKMILQKLRQRNPDSYDILIKVKLLGIPPSEVAKEYKISINGVNNRIFRTKIWIEKELKRT